MKNNKSRLFSATWCSHCIGVKQYIVDNNLPIELVDIDMYPDTAREAGVRQIPCLQKEDGSLLSESKEILKYLKGEY